MKKLLAILLGVMMLAFAASCQVVTEDNRALNLMAPDGAPGMAIAKIAYDGSVGGREVNTSIVKGAADIKASVVTGEADMAIMPLNLAAQIYNSGSVDIKLVSVNVLGSLYMVGKESIASLNDLVGKVVYNIGQGGTPDLTFKYILTESGIPFELAETPVEGKIALHYVADAADLMGLFVAGQAEYGIMGEPAVTNCNKKAGTQTVLNIQEEWKKVTGQSYTQAGLIVKAELADKADFMSALKAALSENGEWAKTNADKIKDTLVSKGSSLKLDYNADIVSRCNVGYLSAAAGRADIESYFNVLMGFKPALIGGKLPDDGFYYGV